MRYHIAAVERGVDEKKNIHSTLMWARGENGCLFVSGYVRLNDEGEEVKN